MSQLLRAYVNGVEHQYLHVLDRGLHYGDGVFRTLRVLAGQPCQWSRQLLHLLHDASRIGLAVTDEASLVQQARVICSGVESAVLKIILTRGASARGYQSSSATINIIMLLYSRTPTSASTSSQGIRVRLCETRLSQNPRLAGIKHLNRLEQVLARSEWQDEAIAEGLMLDTSDHLIEGVSSNLFLVQSGVLRTANLSLCGVAGVTREMVLESAPQYANSVEICALSLQDLYEADECFICNSLIGIQPITQMEDKTWGVGAITRSMQQHIGELCLEKK